MPAVITHHFFGLDTLEAAQAQLGPFSKAERDAFLLGNQGPDPLFYLVIDPLIAKDSRVGNLLHHEQTSKLLATLARNSTLLPEPFKRFARAWYLGFCCHYLLDSAVHPLVYYWQYGITQAGIEGLSEKEGSDVHAEVERDFDEMVLFAKTGRTIETFRPYNDILQASDEVLSAIDELLFTSVLSCYGMALDQKTFTHAVKSFRIMQRIFYSPNEKLHRILGGVERTVTGKDVSFYCAMAHRSRMENVSDFDNREHKIWENPFTKEFSRKSFWDLYNATKDAAPKALAAFASSDFNLASAEVITHGLNFSGEPISG